MKRKVILIDLDNVVYDWVQAMAYWLYKNKVFNFTGRILEFPEGKVREFIKGKDLVVPTAMHLYKSWEVWEDWGIPKGEFIRWWRLGIEQGVIYAKGYIIHGAREALWQLSDAEWDIHIATNRLTKFGLHDKIVENTVSWLRDNNIPYRQLSFVSDKKVIFADAIIDDRKDNMDWSGDFHGHCFPFPANHNTDRGVTELEQKLAWKQIVEALVG
jgi:5'(3')-deoxyribonucleotidase